MKNFTFLKPTKTAILCCFLLWTAGINAQDKGFVHTATADNIASNWTYIDHPDLNGNPDARFVFSQRYNGVGNNHPTGIWYANPQWAIYNEDVAAMPVGAAFNIYIPDDSPVETHICTAANTTDYYTRLSGYTEGNYLFYNTYYNPHNVYNPFVYGNDFVDGDRYLYIETFSNIPSDAAFIIMNGAGTSATRASMASTADNTSGNRLTIDHPALNSNPDAVFVFSHYYGIGGNETALPMVAETEYVSATGRWQIYAYGGNFPTGVWIDFIIPNEILGTNDVQSQISKISLYPNPVMDFANISSSQKEIQVVQIYDVSGKLVSTFTQIGKTVKLNVSALPSGMYIAKIKTDEGWFSQKLIKK